MHARQRPRLKRQDSFFGLHYDFHAGADGTEIGKDLTRASLRTLCRKVRPDYLQCDCKGHPGIASYPTRVGTPAPGFVRDPLRLWRDVTAAEGVALYVHYSGVWDNAAVKRHPSWARVDEEGRRDPQKTSVFGPYVDRLLIPQLKELNDVYGVDGVWVDGDCWGTMPDYGPRVREAFRRATGIRTLPRRAGDPHFETFLTFCREGFRRYLARYTDALHAHNPAFQVCSNWAYSSFMPEPVATAVAFLSGDYSLQDSLNTARLEARYLAQQGMPWDLMAWSFSARFGEGAFTTKTLPQLQQEAAAVISLGGGFQAYVQQRRDGSINRWHIDRLAALGQFCRDRQAICHRSTAVPQIGLILSTDWFYRKLPRPFAAWKGELEPLHGILKLLLEGRQAVDLVSEHHLAGRMAEYPLLILPESDPLAPAFRRALLAYVRAGGALLIVGPDACAPFHRVLGVRRAGPVTEEIRWLEHAGELAGIKTRLRAVAYRPRVVKPFGRLHAVNDRTPDPLPAAGVARLGKGRIAGVNLNLGERGLHATTTVLREFLNGLVRELFPHPLVEVTGPGEVDVVVRRQADKLAVHLVNTGGPHADKQVYTYDQIPPAGPLTVSIRMPRRPRQVRLEPEGRALRFRMRAGRLTVTLPAWPIHSALVVD